MTNLDNTLSSHKEKLTFFKAQCDVWYQYQRSLGKPDIYVEENIANLVAAIAKIKAEIAKLESDSIEQAVKMADTLYGYLDILRGEYGHDCLSSINIKVPSNLKADFISIASKSTADGSIYLGINFTDGRHFFLGYPVVYDGEVRDTIEAEIHYRAFKGSGFNYYKAQDFIIWDSNN